LGKHFIELCFISNIKPGFFITKENRNVLINVEIFVFFTALKMFLNKKTNKNLNFKKIFFLVRPFKKKTVTYLRAPYRYKLARNQVTFSRYYITCQLVFYNKNILEFKNVYSITQYNANFFLNIRKISTNVSNLVYIKHSYDVKAPNLFKY
jgi:hypothetical protein